MVLSQEDTQRFFIRTPQRHPRDHPERWFTAAEPDVV